MRMLDGKRMRNTLFVMPAFLLHICVVMIPAFSMFYYSLTDWNGLSAPGFVGLDNFRRMLRDSDFHHAIRNNVVWMLLFLVIPLVLGLGFALLFTRLGRSQMLFRSLIFLPYVVSATIAGKVFSVLYSPYSGISSLAKEWGIGFLADFAPLGNEKQALFAVAFVDNWHWWGFVLVLMLSALHQVDHSLYEAARIEGANPVQLFFNVTLPQIKPTILSYVAFITVASFTTFDYVWVMTQGGPARATELCSTWVYKRTFVSYEAGYGSSLSLSICLCAIAVYLLFQLFRRKED